MSDDKKKSGWVGMNDAVNNALGITDDQPVDDTPLISEDELLNSDDDDIFNQLPAARSGTDDKKTKQPAAKAKPVARKAVKPDPFPADSGDDLDDIFNQMPASRSGDNTSTALGIPTGKSPAKKPFGESKAKQADNQQQRLALEKQKKEQEKKRRKEEAERKALKEKLARQKAQMERAESDRAKQELLAKQQKEAKLKEELKRAELERKKAEKEKKAAEKARLKEEKERQKQEKARAKAEAAERNKAENLRLKPLDSPARVARQNTWIKPLIKTTVMLSVVAVVGGLAYLYKDTIVKKVKTVWQDYNKPAKVVKNKKTTKKIKKKSTKSKSRTKPKDAVVTQVVVNTGKIPAWIDYFQDNLKSGDKGPAMVKIFANQYFMGGQSDKELPRHMVELQEFAVSLYEVTFKDYDKFAEATGRAKPKDDGWGRNQRPVINVSWFDAKAYAEWLSNQTNQRYRLPTEAEWEYMATTGKGSLYPWGNTLGANNANCDGCQSQWEGRTAPVGSFKPNRFGVFDTSGNVAEWTEDCYHSSYIGAPEDGSAWMTDGDCSMNMVRGGGHTDLGNDISSSARNYTAPSSKSNYIGIRLVREI